MSDYELQRRIPSGRKFGRKADPSRPYIWERIATGDDRELLEDMKYKISDGDRAEERLYRIVDKRERR